MESIKLFIANFLMRIVDKLVPQEDVDKYVDVNLHIDDWDSIMLLL